MVNEESRVRGGWHILCRCQGRRRRCASASHAVGSVPFRMSIAAIASCPGLWIYRVYLVWSLVGGFFEGDSRVMIEIDSR